MSDSTRRASRRQGSPYRAAGPVLLRAPSLPVQALAALRGPEAGARARELLDGDPLVRRAVAVASPDLLRALGGPRRAAAMDALLRYLVRMATRPTPFGLFAGVALVPLAHGVPPPSCTGDPVTRTRPDAGWLLDLVAEVERRPEARRELRLVAEPSAWLAGDRVRLPPGLHRGAGDADGPPPTGDASVRATRPVRAALARAVRPLPRPALVAGLADGGPVDRAERLVEQLWLGGLLRTELTPPVTGDPARWVSRVLAGAPGAADERGRLERALGEAAAADLERRAPDHARCGGARLQVDARLVLDAGALPPQLGEDAARAAELMLRLGPAPAGPAWLAAYRSEFAGRYGVGRLVGLPELLDPRTGLGPPRMGAGPTAEPPRRHRALAALAHRALREGAREVELTEALLDDLGPAAALGELPLSLDVPAFVCAPSAAAVARGEWLFVVGPNAGPAAAGRTAGRFADLLGPAAHTALADLARAEEALRSGAVFAELSYRPRAGRSVNVAVRPLVRRHEIPVGVPASCAPADVVPASSLSVVLREGRLRLWSAAHDAEVVVTAGHMLNPAGAPELCRFLSLVGMDGVAVAGPPDWGPFADLPSLPRLRAGRVVLSPARWTLTTAGRTTADAEREVERRCADDLPREAYLAAGDNRLLLDLADPRDRAAVAAELRRAGRALLEEALPGPADAWLPGPRGRHVVEVVVPLVRRPTVAPAAAQGAVVPAPRPAPVAERVRVRAPGSDWLSVKLYAPWPEHDGLLTGPVARLCERLCAEGAADGWFFLRYADPEPHLRVRWHGEPACLAARVLPAVVQEASRLIAQSGVAQFALDRYEREVERYGGEDAVAVSERVFAADSRSTAALLAAVPFAAPAPSGLTPRALLAVHTCTDLLAALAGDGAAALVGDLRAVDAAVHRAAGAALRRHRDALLGGAPAGPEPVPALLAARRAALAAALGGPLTARDGLTATPAALVASHLHMHCNRLLGPDRAAEAVVLDLVSRVARAGPAARTGTGGGRAPAQG